MENNYQNIGKWKINSVMWKNSTMNSKTSSFSFGEQRRNPQIYLNRLHNINTMK